MKSVCLNMVVKNESKVIEKCLASVKPFIDSWVIVDLGSTDGTREKIRDSLRGVPGELYQRSMMDGASSRNVAMELARGRGDYLLFLDADQTFSYNRLTLQPLTLDCYYGTHVQDHAESLRLILAKQGLDWIWQGAMHEEIFCSQVKNCEVLEGVRITTSEPDGMKLQEQIQLMQKLLEKDPGNVRMLYHLGSAFERVGNKKAALECYDKRVRYDGFPGELYYCFLRSGFLKAKLKWPANLVMERYSQAHSVLPERAEANAYFADFMIKRGNHLMGYLLVSSTLSLPYPAQVFRVDIALYKYGREVLLAECAWRLGKMGETYQAIEKLLALPDLPEHIRTNMEKNRALKMFDSVRDPFAFLRGGMR